MDNFYVKYIDTKDVKIFYHTDKYMKQFKYANFNT